MTSFERIVLYLCLWVGSQVFFCLFCLLFFNLKLWSQAPVEMVKALCRVWLGWGRAASEISFRDLLCYLWSLPVWAEPGLLFSPGLPCAPPSSFPSTPQSHLAKSCAIHSSSGSSASRGVGSKWPNCSQVLSHPVGCKESFTPERPSHCSKTFLEMQLVPSYFCFWKVVFVLGKFKNHCTCHLKVLIGFKAIY